MWTLRYIIVEVLRELFKAGSFRTPRRWVLYSALATACIYAFSKLFFLSGGTQASAASAFLYDRVKGSVAFDDGELIRVHGLSVCFVPIVSGIVGGEDPDAIAPRSGIGIVDVATGTFSNVTTYRYGDGIVQGRHRVCLLVPANQSGDEGLIPERYRIPSATPIVVNSKDSPFAIRISRK